MFESTAPAEPQWIKQQLRVPRDDETLFARPDLSAVIEDARDNVVQFDRTSIDLAGRTLGQLREWSRKDILQAARQYTAQLTGEPISEQANGLLLVAGHQPSLFHPGVWVKNFAVGALAKSCSGTALNLIVDNDTLSSTQMRVPVGDRNSPQIEMVPFDDERPPQPWEEAKVANGQLFASFGNRVGALMSKWNLEPLLGGMWPDAVEVANASGSLRDALTAARHRQEQRWGCENLELPISRVCELNPFLWFASHLLVELPRFRDVHNEVLGEFRKVNRIRSRTHPVPELSAEHDGWLEAPFWVWRAGEDQRQRAFAKQVGQEIHLSDGKETIAKLPLSPGGEACCAVEALRELPQRGIRLRTRALTTTLFSRLCLSDLFVHGIGGSKYDEMTDRIIHRFYRLSPPSFLTLSATLHLPLAEPFSVSTDDVTRLRRLQRDLAYNSDRYLTDGDNANVDSLITEKQQLIAEQKDATAGNLSRRQRRLRSRRNHDRFRRLREIGASLSELTVERQQQIETESSDVEQQLAANAILTNRELPFCLYPDEKLRSFMTELPVE
ncbi:MAG: hypothetical protein HOL01_18595 [Planctomycetaceae bacterium]|nr:hypothetical protein [Planctomycetaceae bacterium]